MSIFKKYFLNYIIRHDDFIISIDDFERLKPISKGHYGIVYLVRKKNTKNIYAMKIVNAERFVIK